MLVRDVCIVGGAAIGLPIAHFLKRDLKYDGTVTVIERDPAYARAAATLSATSIWQQFTPENIRLSFFGRDFFRDLKHRFGREANIDFTESGYLVLAEESGRPVLGKNHAVQSTEGADIVFDEPHALLERFPWLNIEGIAAGHLGPHRRRLLRRPPAAVAAEDGLQGRRRGDPHRQVVNLTRDRSRLTHVVLASGETIACGLVINVADPSASDVAAVGTAQALHLHLPLQGPRARSAADSRHLRRLRTPGRRDLHLRHVAVGRNEPARARRRLRSRLAAF
ncbi:FAD-dependent oxidoreductase [Breoghania sp.]|uniref:FAD-dependent oxidoreductase n=1 Tax=Breoghania sp. TaxID=2065378 RepID=UPI00260AD013|nr:FAD-dependent oxidoreductase [Breoghania sp.]MDJ0931639.1 FAD-dependent oxidoreductase [Breoghania sp.]